MFSYLFCTSTCLTLHLYIYKASQLLLLTFIVNTFGVADATELIYDFPVFL